MGCSHPMIRHENPYNDRVWFCKYTPEKMEELKKHNPTHKIDKIKCGKCLHCRISNSKTWANRLICESLYHDEQWYLTLTYDDDHIKSTPVTHYMTDEYGEVYEELVEEVTALEKKDMQDFYKRLRQHIVRDQGKDTAEIKYYLGGEYGEHTHRAHYHTIIFNLHIPDLKPTGKKNHLGQPYSESKWLSDIWGKGFVTIGQVTWESCAYCARYIMKKKYGDQAKEEYENKPPEYMTNSHGIGTAYFMDHYKEIYTTDELIIPTGNGKVKKSIPPAYFDKLFEQIDPEKLEEIKEERKRKAEEAEKIMLQKSSYDYETLMEVQEKTLQDKLKKLKRDKI